MPYQVGVDFRTLLGRLGQTAVGRIVGSDASTLTPTSPQSSCPIAGASTVVTILSYDIVAPKPPTFSPLSL